MREELSDDLVTVLREILSTIVRSVQARHATVTVAVDGRQLVAEVDHDGAVQQEPDLEKALVPLRRQAEQWGGSALIHRR